MQMAKWPTPAEIEADTAKWLVLLHGISDPSWLWPKEPKRGRRDARQSFK
jgi:hypothetical protein